MGDKTGKKANTARKSAARSVQRLRRRWRGYAANSIKMRNAIKDDVEAKAMAYGKWLAYSHCVAELDQERLA